MITELPAKTGNLDTLSRTFSFVSFLVWTARNSKKVFFFVHKENTTSQKISKSFWTRTGECILAKRKKKSKIGHKNKFDDRGKRLSICKGCNACSQWLVEEFELKFSILPLSRILGKKLIFFLEFLFRLRVWLQRPVRKTWYVHYTHNDQ